MLSAYCHYGLLKYFIKYHQDGETNKMAYSKVIDIYSLQTMDYSTLGFPVLHQLPEFTQTHVHWVGDNIQPSHPRLYPYLPAFNLSHYQGLFKWVSSLHQVGKILEFQFQHQSFQWTFRMPFPPLGDLPDLVIEPASPPLAGRFFTTEPPGKFICVSLIYHLYICMQIFKENIVKLTNISPEWWCHSSLRFTLFWINCY